MSTPNVEQHKELLDHGWLFNETSGMYTVDFLMFPAELPQQVAYDAHLGLINWYENHEDQISIVSELH